MTCHQGELRYDRVFSILAKAVFAKLQNLALVAGSSSQNKMFILALTGLLKRYILAS